MKAGEKVYSKKLKRIIEPGEDIYLHELKAHIEERISFYKNVGCGTAGCNTEELILRNELNRVIVLLEEKDEAA
jgi:hypothetical protein